MSARPRPALELRPVGPDAPGADLEDLIAEFGGDAATAREVLAQTFALLTREPRPAPWGAYLAYCEGRSVGTCAFKAAPDGQGAVEIAYMTWPASEGQGAGTAMAAALVEMAERSGARTARAHTLREENASTAILRRHGFACLGEVEEPEDGLVWRWERKLGGPG